MRIGWSEERQPYLSLCAMIHNDCSNRLHSHAHSPPPPLPPSVSKNKPICLFFSFRENTQISDDL